MSLEELQVRGRVQEWEGWKSRYDQFDTVELVAGTCREGVRDAYFHQTQISVPVYDWVYAYKGHRSQGP